MAIEIKTYNPFDYLETKEEIDEYLNNAYQDEDQRVFLVALGGIWLKSRAWLKLRKKLASTVRACTRLLPEKAIRDFPRSAG